MMNVEREDLSVVESYDQFFALRQKLASLESQWLYDFLFPISIRNNGDSADVIAGRLLIELEPKCTERCSILLSRISASNWNLSLREVPFYLVSQFGKWNLLAEAERYLSGRSAAERQGDRVTTVMYWAQFPTSELSKPFHYWEWQDVIEGPDA